MSEYSVHVWEKKKRGGKWKRDSFGQSEDSEISFGRHHSSLQSTLLYFTLPYLTFDSLQIHSLQVGLSFQVKRSSLPYHYYYYYVRTYAVFDVVSMRCLTPSMHATFALSAYSLPSPTY